MKKYKSFEIFSLNNPFLGVKSHFSPKDPSYLWFGFAKYPLLWKSGRTPAFFFFFFFYMGVRATPKVKANKTKHSNKQNTTLYFFLLEFCYDEDLWSWLKIYTPSTYTQESYHAGIHDHDRKKKQTNVRNNSSVRVNLCDNNKQAKLSRVPKQFCNKMKQ